MNTDDLRGLFLFEHLSEDQLAWLVAHGRVETHAAGTRLLREGEPATCFFVLLDGAVALSRTIGGRRVETNRTDHRGSYFGATQAYVGAEVLATKGYQMNADAITDVRLYQLPADDFGEVFREWFPMAVHLLEGLFFGMRNTQRVVGERERLLALGALSAGLTHELNNPAAAAVRATAALRERVAGMRHKLALLAGGSLDPAALPALVRLQESAVEQVSKAADLGPMEAADREDELADWLADRGVDGGWDLAPVLVGGGLDADWLERAISTCPATATEAAVRWLAYTVETETLMNEVEDAANRISSLVGAARQYSQVDRAPFQVVDVHELLDSTLVMLGGKLGDGVRVVKDYDRALPPLPAHAAELNQVWTNLVDNAVAAMGGRGTLTVRTARDGDHLLVEVGDTGTGIPPGVRDRIFEPFFTTKAVGEGTGLGLDITWRIVVERHGGDLRVESEPGDTRFLVRLPLTGVPARDPGGAA